MQTTTIEVFINHRDGVALTPAQIREDVEFLLRQASEGYIGDPDDHDYDVVEVNMKDTETF